MGVGLVGRGHRVSGAGRGRDLAGEREGGIAGNGYRKCKERENMGREIDGKKIRLGEWGGKRRYGDVYY